MFWSLEINVPRSTYRPGDTVTGAVHLASQSARDLELDVGSIVIEFTGKTTATKPWPSIPHTIRLFSSKKTLLSGPKKLHLTNRLTRNTNEIELNFSFTIPSSCDVVERSSISSSSFFNTEPKQPLPPTFKDDSVQGGSCSIVYQLQATLLSLVKDGYYTNQGCSKKVEISVYRCRSIDQPVYSLNSKTAAFTYRSLLLLHREESQLARRPPTMKGD